SLEDAVDLIGQVAHLQHDHVARILYMCDTCNEMARHAPSQLSPSSSPRFAEPGSSRVIDASRCSPFNSEPAFNSGLLDGAPHEWEPCRGEERCHSACEEREHPGGGGEHGPRD